MRRFLYAESDHGEMGGSHEMTFRTLPEEKHTQGSFIPVQSKRESIRTNLISTEQLRLENLS